MARKTLYELSLIFNKDIPAEADLLFGVLNRTGVPFRDIIVESTDRKEKVSIYLSSKSSLDRLLKKISSLKIQHLNIVSKDLSDMDWRKKWKENYKPFKITKSFTVVPSWMRKDKDWNCQKTVFLDIGMAFGSGLHPTTKFTAEFVELKRASLGFFLDVGTGSGILSLMASKLGAERIYCIDSDPEAIRVAKDNAVRNSCRIKYAKALDMKKFKPPFLFDFVAANLQTNILLDLKKELLACVKKGGYLAVSGIASCNYKEFRKNFVNTRMRCLRIKNDNNWYAVLYKKIS